MFEALLNFWLIASAATFLAYFLFATIVVLATKQRSFLETVNQRPILWQGRVALALGLSWLVSTAAFAGTFLSAIAGLIFGVFVRVPILATMLGVVIGLALFGLRQWRKDHYGRIEVFVAVATLALTSTQPFAAASAISYIGGVYVLVRGLVNVAEFKSTGEASRG